MEKMYISLEGINRTTESVFDGFEPRRSRSSIASYRCKLYRAHLDQRADSQHILFAANQGHRTPENNH